MASNEARDNWVSAPDVSELMEILLNSLSNNQNTYYPTLIKDQIGYRFSYDICDDFGSFDLEFRRNKNAAVCVADYLVWLIENKHIKPEDLKLWKHNHYD